MNNEQEIKKLLSFRESMEIRIKELKQEISDLETAIEKLDRFIVNQGFRTFSTADSSINVGESKLVVDTVIQDESIDQNQMSITSKDGTVLGSIQIDDHSLIFTPEEVFKFGKDIPPFQSFLIERILDNMRKTDEERSLNGELDPSEILSYEVKDQDGQLISLTVNNYGGERRLREINSSLRWTMDKMYDRITKS